MGARTSYEPGTFCWTDLASPDPAAAIAFYSAVFGWEPREVPGSAGYTLMCVDGAEVCGIHPAPPAGGALPAWISWVSVEDVDASLAEARALGGSVLEEAHEVTERGRAGRAADPQGAPFGLWQRRAFAGARCVNQVGAMVLNQLNAHDPPALIPFYRSLFGWEIDRVTDDPAPYWGITNRGHLNGGMMGLQPPAPCNWLVYFTSEDVDGSDALIVDRGGAVVVPPLEIATGRILVARDPQHAFFALYEGVVDP